MSSVMPASEDVSGLVFALVTFKVDKVDQEGETQQAGFACSAGALGEDHGKGVGGGAALLHQTSPNFANLRCVGIIVLASDDFILLVMEIERNVDQALAAAAITCNAATSATSFGFHHVNLLSILMVGELWHKAMRITMVEGLGVQSLALRRHWRQVWQKAAAWAIH